LLQGILHELIDLKNLDSPNADDFEPGSVLWIEPLLLLGNFLPVAIAKLHGSGWLPRSLQVTPSCLPLHLTFMFLIINGKWLSVNSIGGEESSAVNDCVQLFACAAFANLHLNPGGYLSGTFVFAQDDFHLHGFVLLTSALSSGETIGYQHPLFLHCTVMHLT